MIIDPYPPVQVSVPPPPTFPAVTPRPPYVPPRPSYQAPGYYEPLTSTFRPEVTSKYHTDVSAVIKVVSGGVGDTQRFPKSKPIS